MAGALAGGLVKAGVCKPSEIRMADLHRPALQALESSLGICPVASNAGAVEGVDAVLLCVKPGDAGTALGACGKALDGQFLISIAAGISIKALAGMVEGSVAIVRAMPNTPARVGAGATAYSAGPGVSDTRLAITERIFSSVGRAWEVGESALDAVTGLSGSGPAYVCLVLEALADGGVAAGLPRTLAAELALQTVRGAAKMVCETGTHPAVLREAVTSPGGTTAAGLAILESAAVRAALANAVVAAKERSEQLGT